MPDTPLALLLARSFDRESAVPLYRQVYTAVRQAILSGQLPPGTRLPSTRNLAVELDLSRNTVMNAFEQLAMEGYLEGRVGEGTRVSTTLPDELLHLRERSISPLRLDERGGHILSRRGRVLADVGIFGTQEPVSGPFVPGRPALDEFPLEIWTRLLSRHWRGDRATLLAYGDPSGYAPLREEIAAYLRSSRGVRCDPGQVVITSGLQGGLDLVARVLLNPGDAAWIEDPGYIGARAALLGNGAPLIPVPVDEEGLVVARGVERAPAARLAYVTPSDQFPLGMTMSLRRRLELLEWAGRGSAWVVEDDFDAELRSNGRPLGALQGLDAQGVVIYLGTFSKVMFPALRIGYLIVPGDLVDAFVAARTVAGWCSPTVEQMALADFLAEGHLSRHTRRMCALYGERRAAMVELITAEMEGLLEVQDAGGGMQVLAWLPAGVDDREVECAARAEGVIAPSLSSTSIEPQSRGGLRLGFTHLDRRAMQDGLRRFRVVLQRML